MEASGRMSKTVFAVGSIHFIRIGNGLFFVCLEDFIFCLVAGDDFHTT